MVMKHVLTVICSIFARFYDIFQNLLVCDLVIMQLQYTR